MTRVANYAQLSDVSFDLRLGGDIDRRLEQNITDAPVSGEGALLTWNVRREGVGSVTYQVKVNDAVAATYTVTSGDWSAVQEAMGTDSIQLGDNTVDFVVTGGDGTLSIGDVMLWYRVEV
jgi:hypothetical protein